MSNSPQQGIFVEGSRDHWFVEVEISDPAAVPAALDRIAGAAAGTTPADTVQMVVGFGPDLAAALLADVPARLRPFTTIEGKDRHAPGTQRDLLVWVHCDDRGRNFEVVTEVRRALAGNGRFAQDVPAWVYRDNRDLTGFIDGTENPPVDTARDLVLLDGAHDGATLAVTQRWVHRLDEFADLDTEAQEQVIGRTKPDSVQLDPVADDSHVGRVVTRDDDGEELEIYRRSVPYGTAAEAGLFFIAFTNDLDIIQTMIESMMGVDGAPDRLTDFSTAESGSYWLIPSAEQLAALESSG